MVLASAPETTTWHSTTSGADETGPPGDGAGAGDDRAEDEQRAEEAGPAAR